MIKTDELQGQMNSWSAGGNSLEEGLTTVTTMQDGAFDKEYKSSGRCDTPRVALNVQGYWQPPSL